MKILKSKGPKIEPSDTSNIISSKLLHSLCYVICNCNAANMDVVAFYLLEQLNNNFILYTREINFSVHIYIFCPPFFFPHSQKKVSLNAATIEKKANSLIVFHFDERSKSSQRILLAFGSLLSFFHRTSFTK